MTASQQPHSVQTVKKRRVWRHVFELTKCGQVFLAISLTSILLATRHGYGQHLADLESNPAEAVKLVAVSQFFAVGAGAVGKTSIAMMLPKVLDVTWQRVVTWGLVITVNFIIWGFAIFLWMVIWQDRLVQTCVEASGIWRFAVFGAGK